MNPDVLIKVACGYTYRTFAPVGCPRGYFDHYVSPLSIKEGQVSEHMPESRHYVTMTKLLHIVLIALLAATP